MDEILKPCPRVTWRSVRRNIIAGLLTIWLGGAFLVALVFQQILPPLNWKGQAYIGLTWPAALICHEALSDRCSVVPPPIYSRYLFTFDDDARTQAQSGIDNGVRTRRAPLGYRGKL